MAQKEEWITREALKKWKTRSKVNAFRQVPLSIPSTKGESRRRLEESSQIAVAPEGSSIPTFLVLDKRRTTAAKRIDTRHQASLWVGTGRHSENALMHQRKSPVREEKQIALQVEEKAFDREEEAVADRSLPLCSSLPRARGFFFPQTSIQKL
ncbi:hypothetical protein HPP92_015048 [Vanilla planifolia]|uniref:Uncharacterized protein n=1 Tax=Vanilla planifolia TaxID=51239 RepID=A0A835QLK0_VANPL|nr:hypothetical protein HPP92_015048 [Vanilla planifolia]